MKSTHFTLQVECQTDYRQENTPHRFHIGSRCIGIDDVIDRWLSREYRYFKVAGDDGGTYILQQDVNSRTWQLTLFDARGLKGDI